MCRHMYDSNLVNCDVKQLIHLIIYTASTVDKEAQLPISCLACCIDLNMFHILVVEFDYL